MPRIKDRRIVEFLREEYVVEFRTDKKFTIQHILHNRRPKKYPLRFIVDREDMTDEGICLLIATWYNGYANGHEDGDKERIRKIKKALLEIESNEED